MTTVPSDSAVVGLWPLLSPTGLDERFTKWLVYTSPQSGAPPGEQPLTRPLGPVYLVPSPDLRDDTRTLLEIEYAANMVNEATGGRLPFSLTTAPPTDGIRFDLRFDPTDPNCKDALAFCRRATRGGSITGGELVFCDGSALSIALAT